MTRTGNNESVSRRGLLRSALAAAAVGVADGAALPQGSGGKSVIGMAFEPRDTVRLAVIGCGGRGTGVLRDYLALDGVQVTAVCDVVKEHAQRAQANVERAGQRPPAIYANGERDFENLLRRDDVDFAYIATPWEWHVPQALAAMNNGKHAFVEVPAATTIEDCWKLVDTSEKTQRHCIIAENCCYGQTELIVLNMIRGGLFGDVLYGEAAYLHDLRRLLFEDRSEGLWRRLPHTQREGNLYPTHGLGPVANYMGVNRGDRFDYLVSMSSPARGLDAWRAANVPKDSPKWKEKYINGDMNVSLIKTANGQMINLQHDVVNPHPYDRLNLIQGVKGIFRDYPPRIYFDGQKPEAWQPIDSYKDQYEHTLWKRQGELARKLGGHGGMDFLMVYRLVECMRNGLVPDMDVYDAAAWSAPGPLSDESVRRGSVPVKIPDFTRGRWKEKRGWLA
ncbi:MAG TPA: Gfo/Idh/MocA family oxidoreductase [Bryobacteraceae bacterium]|nr:Gfo/Idh/MocA family oxidoreductase [Bryobacteraceae bacterium]